jgi:hypothetical protein
MALGQHLGADQQAAATGVNVRQQGFQTAAPAITIFSPFNLRPETFTALKIPLRATEAVP